MEHPESSMSPGSQQTGHGRGMHHAEPGGALRPGSKKSGGSAHDASPGSKVVYTCPMHPEIRSANPGSCPKCGMKLVEKKVAK